MKPANVKSRILKRLIPVLLVPVVLSSNFAAIYASADEETVIEQNSPSETIENESTETPAEEEVVSEEVSQEPAPEEVAPAEGGDGSGAAGEVPTVEPSVDPGTVPSVEPGTVPSAEPAEAATVEPGEGEAAAEETSGETEGETSEETEETEEEEVEEELEGEIDLHHSEELEPNTARIALVGDSYTKENVTNVRYQLTVDGETVSGRMRYGQTRDIYLGEYEESTSIRFSFDYDPVLVTLTASFGEDSVVDPEDYTVEFGETLEDSYVLSLSAVKADNTEPKFKAVTYQGNPVSESPVVYSSTNPADLVIGVTADDADPAEDGTYPAVSKGISGLGSVQFKVNDQWVTATGGDYSGAVHGSATWSPRSYGTYKITAVKITDRCDNSLEVPLSEVFFCYRNPYNTRDEVIVNGSVDSGKWLNVYAQENAYNLSVTVFSCRPVETICINDENPEEGKTFVASGSSGDFIRYPDTHQGLFKTTASFRLENPVNFTKTYSFTYKYCNDDTPHVTESYKVMVDRDSISTNDVKGRMKTQLGWGVVNRKGIISIPNEDADIEAGSESGFDKAVIKVKKTVYRLFFDDVVTESTYIIKSTDRKSYNADTNSYEYEFLIDSTDLISEGFLNVGYDYTTIELFDKAGNYTVGDFSNGVGDDTDTYPPIIRYIGNLDDVKSPRTSTEGDWVFSKNDVVGKVVVYDAHLDEVSTANIDDAHPGTVTIAKTTDSEVECDTYMDVEHPTNKDTRLSRHFHRDVVYMKEYDYKLSANGVYQAKTTVVDMLGNGPSVETSPLVVIDKENPIVHVDYNGKLDNPDPYYTSYFDLKVIVNDRWIDKVDSQVIITGRDSEGRETTHFDSSIDKINWTNSLGEQEHVMTFPINADGEYQVSYHIYDMATNECESIQEKFIVDTHSPEILGIKYDPDVKPLNGKYYNVARTAIITVKDLTFDTENSKAVIKSEYGEAKPTGWNPVDDTKTTYEMRIPFNEDGIYSYKLLLKDLAGNKPTTENQDEFVIDRTAPVIKLSYDNNNPKNGIYFNTERVGNVTIEDISFSSEKVKVTQVTTENPGVMPSIGGFSSSGKENYASLHFTEDGSYSYTIECEDLAGNTANMLTADMFVVDRTIPEVKFSGVENFSANNGVVAPVVSYIDKNMDINISHVTMTGANNGAVALVSKQDKTEDGFIVSYSDFEHVKGMDDLYVLQANVVDLAGNENKDQLVFSVNRFGSVFVLGSATKELNEKYYTKDPVDISVTEINVDDLVQKTVSISRDGDIKELKSGKQYTVTKQGSDTSWKTYTYTVSKDNFEKDGIYSVTVYTKDRATNVQDNKSRDAEINFAVDKTAPSIVTAGLKSGEVYKETSHSVNIDVTDNMGVKNLTVFKDGKEIESYDEEKLLGDNGVESITLTESDKKQSVKLVAEDIAGNIQTVEYNDILVSTKETEILPVTEENESEGTLDGQQGVLGGRRERGLVGFIILALGVLAAGTGAGVALYKKKQNSTSED